MLSSLCARGITGSVQCQLAAAAAHGGWRDLGATARSASTEPASKSFSGAPSPAEDALTDAADAAVAAPGQQGTTFTAKVLRRGASLLMYQPDSDLQTTAASKFEALRQILGLESSSDVKVEAAALRFRPAR